MTARGAPFLSSQARSVCRAMCGMFCLLTNKNEALKNEKTDIIADTICKFADSNHS